MVSQKVQKRTATLLAMIQRRWSAAVFPGSRDYWSQRYEKGEDSGVGSYGQLAVFKANVINSFVQRNDIRSVLEFGCGDGNQLSLSNYTSYTGLDVAPKAIEICIERFRGDPSKSFFLYSTEHFADHSGVFSADLTMSLDVVFHLVEDHIFEGYMRHLFAAANKFVIVYASNDERADQAKHVRHREFTTWVRKSLPEWRLLEQVENPHRELVGAVADFYMYERTAAA